MITHTPITPVNIPALSTAPQRPKTSAWAQAECGIPAGQRVGPTFSMTEYCVFLLCLCCCKVWWGSGSQRCTPGFSAGAHQMWVPESGWGGVLGGGTPAHIQLGGTVGASGSIGLSTEFGVSLSTGPGIMSRHFQSNSSGVQCVKNVLGAGVRSEMMQAALAIWGPPVLHRQCWKDHVMLAFKVGSVAGKAYSLDLA